MDVFLACTIFAVTYTLIATEKTIPWRRVGTYGTAAVLLLLGVLVLAAPEAVPALTIPGSDAMPQMERMSMSP